MQRLQPFGLNPFFSRRPWGRADLSAWYSAEQTGAGAEPVGEAWLSGPSCIAVDGPAAGMRFSDVAKQWPDELLGDWRVEGEFPLLLKLLFPDQKLSVQVHPDDVQAQAMGQPRGKTECWYVLTAGAGAEVACGLRSGVQPEQMRQAALDGTMESLLQMVPVVAGDMVFVDAGTVHAIGPGVTLLETQQTSDTTFRLYDYGRPRELHLDQGIVVSRSKTRAGKVQSFPIQGGLRLIQEKYFKVDRFEVNAGDRLELHDGVGRPHCFTTLSGSGQLREIGESSGALLQRARAAVVPARCSTVELVASESLVVVRSMV